MAKDSVSRKSKSKGSGKTRSSRPSTRSKEAPRRRRKESPSPRRRKRKERRHSRDRSFDSEESDLSSQNNRKRSSRRRRYEEEEESDASSIEDRDRRRSERGKNKLRKAKIPDLSGRKERLEREASEKQAAKEEEKRMREVDDGFETIEAPGDSPAPTEEEQGENGPNDHVDPEEARKEAKEPGLVNAAEILESVAEKLKDKSKAPGTGGDFAAAYKELYTFLYARMVHKIYRYFQKLYVRCNKDESKFRHQLRGIPNWNSRQIEEKANEFVRSYPSIVQYFKFAYAANVLLMSVVVQRGENSKEVTVDVPKFTDFVHRCYSESARNIYDYAGVFEPSLPADRRLAIRKELYNVFGEAIGNSLRIMVPLDKIVPGNEGGADEGVGDDYDFDEFGGSENEDLGGGGDESNGSEKEEEGANEEDSKSGDKSSSGEEESESDEESGEDSGSEEESEEEESSEEESSEEGSSSDEEV